MKVKERPVSAGTVLKIGYCLFDTQAGQFSIAWSKHGIFAVHLPVTLESRHHDFMDSLGAVEMPDCPEDVASVIDRIKRLLKGGSDDLRDITLDYTGVTGFRQQVYEAARKIQPGSTRTYGDVAEAIGSRAKCRAVGQALGANRHALIVPCHRVLASNSLGGFSADGGCNLKARLLEIEGVRACR